MKTIEKGPWKARQSADGKVEIQSDDFHHDASLYITGDFENKHQRLAYAEEIARRLNLQNPGKKLSTGEAIDLLFKQPLVTLKSACQNLELCLSPAASENQEAVITIKTLGSGYKRPLPLSGEIWTNTQWIDSADNE
ncbi:hypothetical protein YA0089_27050 [Pseudomonas viridiflava]|uniref:hypothetical protein n=1 Tax=Pseudomonas viridiflava TaxID=33069 RepID=UPI0018E633DD|nr:hypothetical protein [Pseudomonas viridiflava]MBI6727277.1 hypothetical protein [Pseudomonas viridiflava]